MLPPWLIRFVLALALAVLPLQGLAETVQMFLFCQPQPSNATGAAHADHHRDRASAQAGGAHHVQGDAYHGHGGSHQNHGSDSHAGGESSTSHHAAMSDEAPDEGHAGHFCCDVVVAGLTGSAPNVSRFDFPALEPAREAFYPSIYLESPQRPPLA